MNIKKFTLTFAVGVLLSSSAFAHMQKEIDKATPQASEVAEAAKEINKSSPKSSQNKGVGGQTHGQHNRGNNKAPDADTSTTAGYLKIDDIKGESKDTDSTSGNRATDYNSSRSNKQGIIEIDTDTDDTDSDTDLTKAIPPSITALEVTAPTKIESKPVDCDALPESTTKEQKEACHRGHVTVLK